MEGGMVTLLIFVGGGWVFTIAHINLLDLVQKDQLIC
jgi:hypothetical protein